MSTTRIRRMYERAASYETIQKRMSVFRKSIVREAGVFFADLV